MLIGLHVPEIQLFQILTLKIQGQGHGCCQSSKSQYESNILLTHIPLVPCQSAHPFLICNIFKIWPWKSKVKVIAQGHKVCITPYRLISLSFHADRPSSSWDTVISKFDVENSRSRSRVRSKLKVTTWVQHSVNSHAFSFDVNRASHYCVMTFSKFDLENQGPRSWVRSRLKVATWFQHPVESHPFRSVSIGHPIPELRLF